MMMMMMMMICPAWFVVRRTRRAADTSTNRRQGFLCRRTASMEHAADTVEAAAVDHYFPSSTENIFVCHMDTGKADDCFLASAFHKVSYVAAGKTRFYVFKNQHLEISKI